MQTEIQNIHLKKKILNCHILHMYSKSPHMFILRESCKHVSYYTSFPQKGKKKKYIKNLQYLKIHQTCKKVSVHVKANE